MKVWIISATKKSVIVQPGVRIYSAYQRETQHPSAVMASPEGSLAPPMFATPMIYIGSFTVLFIYSMRKRYQLMKIEDIINRNFKEMAMFQDERESLPVSCIYPYLSRNLGFSWYLDKKANQLRKDVALLQEQVDAHIAKQGE